MVFNAASLQQRALLVSDRAAKVSVKFILPCLLNRWFAVFGAVDDVKQEVGEC